MTDALVFFVAGNIFGLAGGFSPLETMIAWCMERICKLAKTGEFKERKMDLVALEYRARLVLERWKKRDEN